jgi:hypothetical protein
MHPFKGTRQSQSLPVDFANFADDAKNDCRQGTIGRRVAASSKPIDFSAGKMAPRLGKSAPLTNIHKKCKSARLVPIDKSWIKRLKTLMV